MIKVCCASLHKKKKNKPIALHNNILYDESKYNLESNIYKSQIQKKKCIAPISILYIANNTTYIKVARAYFSIKKKK